LGLRLFAYRTWPQFDKRVCLWLTFKGLPDTCGEVFFIRRVRDSLIKVLVFGIIFSFIFSISSPSFSSNLSKSKKALKFNKQRAIEIQNSLNGLADKYQIVRWKAEKTQKSINLTGGKISTLQSKIVQRQKVFSVRMNKTYKYGKVGFVEVIFGSTNFYDLVNRFGLLQKILESDIKLVNEIKDAKTQLETEQAALITQKKKYSQLSLNLKKQQKSLMSNLLKQQGLLAQLQKSIKKEELLQYRALQTKFTRSSRGVRSFSFSIRGGFLFPVAGAHSFSNDWGNPRSGGRHHQGTDIFAVKGTPVVAVVSGTVTHRIGGLGGISAYLHGSDGNSYYYAHLNSFAASGGVSQGQVIGYVGNTGNARGGAPHLHFEVHPGGGGAVNPYPILRNAD
jgi:murein DD-endopeptidase MepM/ murein hydrolase activator NlpD